MFKNYLKIAIRNLYKNKIYSVINLVGLSAGITCCLLITLYVRHELSYDKFQEKGDRIARVIMEYNMGGNINKGNYTGTKVGPAFKKNFPEVEDFVKMMGSQQIVRYNDKLFTEKRFVFVDSNFFDVFSFRLLGGNPKTALASPNSVVLSQTVAKKYFGLENPIGKTIRVSGAGTDYLVAGIVEDCPANSQIKYNFIASFSSLSFAKGELTYWNANYTTYLLLKDKDAVRSLQPKIRAFMRNEMKGEFTGSDYLTYILEPFMDVHLYSEYPGFEMNGSITYIYIVGAVALLILIIACFTFINLCTAKSVERAKEIGIRKVAGAFKRQVFWQFIGESGLLVLLSASLSFILACLLLPAFNGLMGREISVSDLSSPALIAAGALIIVCISFLAGAYPAFILSAFQPVKVLKGAFKNTGSGLLLRRSLFVFQFIISVFLIISAFIVQKQLDFFQNEKLGFTKELVIILPADQRIIKKLALLKTELKQDPDIRYVSLADFEPCNIMGGYSMYNPEMPPGKVFSVFAGTVDQEYLKACDIGIVAGSDLSDQDIKDVSNEDYTKNYFHFILNESAAKQMGWNPEEAIGKKMFMDESRPGVVKAVVKDFHFSSLHNPIQPLILIPGTYGNILLLKTAGKDLSKTIPHIEKVWKTIAPHRPFEYSFLDENYKAMYKSEIRLGKAMNIFTALAITLALMGLFGLSSYTIQQRTKEIGILKVLGAPLQYIVSRLSGQFIRMVIIAVIISVPLAWWAMNSWLQDFSYHIELNAWYFIIPGIIAVLLSLLTVGVKAVKAASENPVKNLRVD
ncbi:MAG: macB 17 [Bacteroidetes bacterium]|nr:macB 17 [Bacteroidota bacterium]